MKMKNVIKLLNLYREVIRLRNRLEKLEWTMLMSDSYCGENTITLNDKVFVSHDFAKKMIEDHNNSLRVELAKSFVHSGKCYDLNDLEEITRKIELKLEV